MNSAVTLRHGRGLHGILTLYYARNTCARTTHIALLDAGAEFSTVRIDTSSNQQNSPEYLSGNPKGRLPAGLRSS